MQQKKVTVLEGYIAKVGDYPELKNIAEKEERMALLRETLKIEGDADISGKHVLLVDDLYRSGATLSAITELLYSQAKVASVSVLTMTKTRVNR